MAGVLQQILSFFMSILAFFVSLLGVPVDTVAYQDIAYGTDQNQTLDLYLPDSYDKEIGLVVMIHGGTWQRGDKSYFADDIANDSSEYNIACASINYRLISYGGSVSMQDIYDDITAAISKCIDIAAEQGITINKVMVRGFSAGAHIALCYAYTQEDVCPLPLVAVYAVSPIADMTDLDLYYADTLAWPENLCKLGSMMCGHTYTLDTFDENIEYIKTISPAQLVTSDSVPTLVFHAKQDPIVPYKNVERLFNAFAEKNPKHDIVISEIAGHGPGQDPAASEELNKLYAQYIKEYLK